MKKSYKYLARIAKTDKDVRLTQALRANQFGANSICGGIETDRFDANCNHVLIEDTTTGALHGCFRFMDFASGGDVSTSYSAQYYDLERLKGYDEPLLEIGRFCIRGGVRDYAVLRVAWAYLTRYVDQHDIALVFGCASFEGVNPLKYTDAFALLKEHYLAPDRWRPQIKAEEVFEFATELNGTRPVPKRVNQNIPTLLRTYLGMGGWVSDHAVVDRELGTLHVFTGVEISAIPKVRARSLRADAGVIEA